MTSDSITEQAARLIDPVAFTLVVNEEGADEVRERLAERRTRARHGAHALLEHGLLTIEAPATEDEAAEV